MSCSSDDSQQNDPEAQLVEMMQMEKLRSDARQRVWKWLHESPDFGEELQIVGNECPRQEHSLLSHFFARGHAPVGQYNDKCDDIKYGIGCFGSMLSFKLHRAETSR